MPTRTNKYYHYSTALPQECKASFGLTDASGSFELKTLHDPFGIAQGLTFNPSNPQVFEWEFGWDDSGVVGQAFLNEQVYTEGDSDYVRKVVIDYKCLSGDGEEHGISSGNYIDDASTPEVYLYAYALSDAEQVVVTPSVGDIITITLYHNLTGVYSL
jgi:hypothetical protein|tara:strand:- start:188 stop:661 length:474 start_codon:yes stop_codon:yes gene_type:complete